MVCPPTLKEVRSWLKGNGAFLIAKMRQRRNKESCRGAFCLVRHVVEITSLFLVPFSLVASVQMLFGVGRFLVMPSVFLRALVLAVREEIAC